MSGGGTRTFLGADRYEAGLRDAQIEAVIVPHPLPAEDRR